MSGGNNGHPCRIPHVITPLHQLIFNLGYFFFLVGMVFEALGVLMAATVQGVFVNSTRVAGNCEKDGDETVTATPEQLNDEVI